MSLHSSTHAYMHTTTHPLTPTPPYSSPPPTQTTINTHTHTHTHSTNQVLRTATHLRPPSLSHHPRQTPVRLSNGGRCWLGQPSAASPPVSAPPPERGGRVPGRDGSLGQHDEDEPIQSLLTVKFNRKSSTTSFSESMQTQICYSEIMYVYIAGHICNFPD